MKSLFTNVSSPLLISFSFHVYCPVLFTVDSLVKTNKHCKTKLVSLGLYRKVCLSEHFVLYKGIALMKNICQTIQKTQNVLQQYCLSTLCEQLFTISVIRHTLHAMVLQAACWRSCLKFFTSSHSSVLYPNQYFRHEQLANYVCQ